MKEFNAVKTYENAYDLKNNIYKDNINRSGVYCWFNKLNGKCYVGSGINLTKRLRSYFNMKELQNNPRPISDALLKYGILNFTLHILEYCSKEDLLSKEQYYLNLLTPEYNVLKYAYSLLGYKHTEDTLDKLRSKIISDDHKKLLSSIHKGKTVNEETKNKLSVALTNFRKDNPLTPEALASIKEKTIMREGVSVSVVNSLTNDVKLFSNQTEAGKYLNVSRQAIHNAILRNSKINKIYIIKKNN